MKEQEKEKYNYTPEELREMKLPMLTWLLNKETNYNANLELARRVVSNNQGAINYYIGVLSLPIITFIEKRITGRDTLSEYFEFLSSPFNSEQRKNEWRRVSLYKGLDCRLDSYTSLITTRHFCRVAKKERGGNNSNRQIFANVDYRSLLHCAEDDDQEIEVGSKLWKARQAFKQLKKRDQDILTYLTIKKMPSLDAWPLLEKYVRPHARDGKTSEEIKMSLTNKQKQDALAVLKSHAIRYYERNYSNL